MHKFPYRYKSVSFFCLSEKTNLYNRRTSVGLRVWRRCCHTTMWTHTALGMAHRNAHDAVHKHPLSLANPPPGIHPVEILVEVHKPRETLTATLCSSEHRLGLPLINSSILTAQRFTRNTALPFKWACGLTQELSLATTGKISEGSHLCKPQTTRAQNDGKQYRPQGPRWFPWGSSTDSRVGLLVITQT